MGTTITPEMLSQIQSKKIDKSNNSLSHNNKYDEKAKRPKFKEIIIEIYFPNKKKN